MSYDLGSFIESEDSNNLAEDFSDSDFSGDSESLEQDFSDVTDEDDLEDVINDKLTKLNESITAGDKKISEELSSQITGVQQTATDIANTVNGQAVLKTGAGVLIYTPDKTGKKINISGDGEDEIEISAYPPKTDSAVLKAANEGLVIGPTDGSTGIAHNVASFNKNGASFIGYDNNNTPKSMLVLNSSGIGLGTPNSNAESLSDNSPKLEIVSKEIKLSNGENSSMSLTAVGFSIASPSNTLEATSAGVSISSGSGKLTISNSGINGVFYCGGTITTNINVNKKSYKLFNFTYNDISSINSKGIPSSDGNWFPYALVRAQIIKPEGLVVSSWDINPSYRDDSGKPIVQIGVYNTTNAKISDKDLKFQILWMNGNYSDDSDGAVSGSDDSSDQSAPSTDSTLTPLYGKYNSSTNKLTITTAIS